MRSKLTGVLLSLAACAPAAATPTNNTTLPYAGHTCGTLQEIIEKSKPIFSGTPVKRIVQGASFRLLYRGQEQWIDKQFVLEFYSRNESNPPQDYSSVAEWAQHNPFDGFSVYELDSKGNPFRHSSADAFFEGGLLLVIYDLDTVDRNNIVLNEPDNYADNAECYIVATPKSSLILQVLKDITLFRLNYKK